MKHSSTSFFIDLRGFRGMQNLKFHLNVNLHLIPLFTNLLLHTIPCKYNMFIVDYHATKFVPHATFNLLSQTFYCFTLHQWTHHFTCFFPMKRHECVSICITCSKNQPYYPQPVAPALSAKFTFSWLVLFV